MSINVFSNRRFSTFIGVFALTAACAYAQSTQDLLATANGFTFGFKDLPPIYLANYSKLPNALADIGREALDSLIAEKLIAHEANLRKTTVPELLEIEVIQRAPKPTAAQVKAVYTANRKELAGKSLEEVRPEIVEFLSGEAREKALDKFIAQLKLKHKFTLASKTAKASSSQETIIATFSGGKISNEDFQRRSKPNTFELESSLYENTLAALEEKIFLTLLEAEANKQRIETSELIAQEITNKSREFTDEERELLEDALRRKLYSQYSVRILLKEPEVFVQKVSADDDPSIGDPNSPVAIVMFTDFQCPACAASHPILKKVIAEFPGKVYFVLRDFPLNRHRNAFLAAQAANAANAQGKFFEYVEILYANQENLDSASLINFAGQLGLDKNKFEQDLTNGRFNKEVNDDIADGKSYAITSTPAIFVNGVKVFNLSARGFRRAITAALEKSSK